MRYSIIYFIAFALLVAAIYAESGQVKSLTSEGDELTLLYPPDRAFMAFGPLSVSLLVKKESMDRIVVEVNGKALRDFVPDSEYECFSLPLEIGVNKIEINAFKKGDKQGKIIFSAFRRSDLEATYSRPPTGYKKYYFHMTLRNECTKCHELSPSQFDMVPLNIAVLSAKTKEDRVKAIESTSTCYSCHKAITFSPFVHGPASVWSCLSCHDIDSMPIYDVKRPDVEVCFRCHTEQKNDWKAKKYLHGPLNTGKCTICHNPHSSENLFNLFKPTWDLCVSCHSNKTTGKHILVGFIYNGHPTNKVPDPLREGKELTCASCHSPHASDYLNLLALNVESQFELCMKCHRDKLL
jgi:predicted CXXCH cytochrome family protein